MSDAIKISNQIYYFKASQSPLSSDVGVIMTQAYTWIFDVGSSDASREFITSLPGKKMVVLSHFHPDHISNISQIDYHQLYVSPHTFKYTHAGEMIQGNYLIDDGIHLKIFELPSSHAKGSLGLEVNGEYAFLGDGIYSTRKNNRVAYNANLLKEEIEVLKSLSARYFLLSHDQTFIFEKAEVIAQLENIYSKREKNNAYIYLDD